MRNDHVLLTNTYICKKDTYMVTKLTLSIERAVIKKAKEYARQTGRSLSELIEAHLEALVQNESGSNPVSLPPKLERLFGAVRFPAHLDHKKEMQKILSKKHGV